MALAGTAIADTVSYDRGYDGGGRSLTEVACSDGENGLMTRYGWKCGGCWKLEYKGRSINVLAIDHAAAGFNIALAAMNDLTNGQAEQFGRVDATATRAPLSDCGL
ncbi:hypothetical protein ACCO45_000345 [Purpureocillium lilacinum]|uniref:Uncharacterized protein n=1 Tax=Purpureocillium lilacinum TaxID=33203 RepID=A0ACC4E6S5_PURLI